MKNTSLIRYSGGFMLILALALAALPTPRSQAFATIPGDKITAEEILAKHLESIGPAASRAAEHSRVLVGSARAIFKVRNSLGAIDGRVVFGSVTQKLLMGMAFPAPNYPGEKVGFDGKKVTVAYMTPGVRSTLGVFLLNNSAIVKEGLIGGTLTSAWALLGLSERHAKIEYAGTDKIDGRPVYKLRYSPSKGADVSVTLFFDAQTFHHVRSQYELVQAPRLAAGGVDAQAAQKETRYKMVEDFSDYKQEGELNLPHSYALQLEITKTTGSSLDKWEVKLDQFAFDQAIDKDAFNVEGN